MSRKGEFIDEKLNEQFLGTGVLTGAEGREATRSENVLNWGAMGNVKMDAEFVIRNFI
jgi:hypothetical protein